MTAAHTQATIHVYVSRVERKSIQRAAEKAGKSMSKYLLDLHLQKQKEDYELAEKNNLLDKR